MQFEDFARHHGLILGSLVAGKWVRVPTEDHPRKRNGGYKYLGYAGWVQNWATMDKPEMWRSDHEVAPLQIRQLQKQANDDRQRAIQQAASKAGWILHQSVMDIHPYLKKKGFPDEVGNVWRQDQALLVIPMRLDGRLIGCQLITEQGEKKFLYGQQTKGTAFVIDAKGIPIFCEGYATALSIRAAMKAMKVKYTIYVCFSASNMKDVARNVEGGIVVADCDKSEVGQQAATSTQKPYWISSTIGEDFNDYHMRVGLFKASNSLKRALFSGLGEVVG